MSNQDNDARVFRALAGVLGFGFFGYFGYLGVSDYLATHDALSAVVGVGCAAILILVIAPMLLVKGAERVQHRSIPMAEGHQSNITSWAVFLVAVAVIFLALQAIGWDRVQAALSQAR